MARIAAGETILIDGGTGTEIEKRGVKMVENAWNGGGALSDPDIVRGVHLDYIQRGAEMVISNTFGTSRHVLQDAGMEEHFEFLNRRGVELAIEAREQANKPNVLVAGGITTDKFTDNETSPAQLKANFEAQAQIQADAGADLIMLEMMDDPAKYSIAYHAAKKTGLPVWAGLSFKRTPAGELKSSQAHPIEDMVKASLEFELPMLFIMHTDTTDIQTVLDCIRPLWDKPLGIYAHTGHFEDPHWIFENTITPADYATQAQGWLDQGVQVIGGCCGISTDHIAALNAMLIPQ